MTTLVFSQVIDPTISGDYVCWIDDKEIKALCLSQAIDQAKTSEIGSTVEITTDVKTFYTSKIWSIK